MKKKIRILHIDDNPYDRLLVKDALLNESDNFELITAENWERFESLLRQHDFDLVLSDFNILGFEGLQVLQHVKEICPDTPVILVTGTGSEEIAIESMRMGASDYIIKSASHIRALPQAIRNALHNKQIQEERDNAIALLKESEAMYHSLFENANLAIFLSNGLGQILLANKDACELFGMTEEELKKVTPKRLVNFSDPTIRAMLAEKVSTGKAKGELTFYKADGTGFMAEVVTADFLDKNGETLTSTIIRDLTMQKEAEKLVRTLSKVVEQSPLSITITDADCNVRFVNEHFMSITQLQMEEVIGKRPDIFNPGYRPEMDFVSMWETLHAGNIWNGEMQHSKKDGTIFWEKVIISPLREEHDDICNYIIITEDISEIKQMIYDLVKAKVKAEESDRLKTSFLHNISHEVRTPMNAIVGFSGLLKDPEIDPSRKTLFTEAIIRSSNKLLDLITEILQVAILEAGQCEINEDEYNLNAVFRMIYEHFNEENAKPQVHFSFKMGLSDEQSNIWTDGNKLKEILSDLVSNALKYTDEGAVEYSYHLKDDFLEFKITDSGIGIPKDKVDKIFLRFMQAEQSLNRNFGGTGLGLYISKSYVEMMGGKIWFDSTPGKGTTFYFTIPYKKSVYDKDVESMGILGFNRY
jgi:PAS domain S-box-containing protein